MFRLVQRFRMRIRAREHVACVCVCVLDDFLKISMTNWIVPHSSLVFAIALIHLFFLFFSAVRHLVNFVFAFGNET